MSEVLQASKFKSLRFQRAKLFFLQGMWKKEIKKSRHVKSKLPIILQRLKIDLCRKFGIRQVNRNNKKLVVSSCSTQRIYQC